MARLDAPYKGKWKWEFDRKDEPWEVYKKRTDKMFNAIPQDKIVGFPVADGEALYFVKSLNPLVLQHIPYMDAYEADDALIRGLRKVDVMKRLLWRQDMKKLFSGGKS